MVSRATPRSATWQSRVGTGRPRRATWAGFRPARGGGPPGPPGPLGGEPGAAAQGALQRAAVPQAPAAVPRAHPARSALALLPDGGRARGRARPGRGVAAPTGAGGRRALAGALGGVLRAPAAGQFARAGPPGRDGGHLGADPAAVRVLAPARGAALPRAVPLSP